MRGSLIRRSKPQGKNTRWAIVFDAAPQVDPTTGARRRKQTWIKYRGTKRNAQHYMTELLGQQQRGEFVEPSKLTFGEHLDRWLENTVKPKVRPHTYETYCSIVEHHIKPKLGAIRLQQLQTDQLEKYFAEKSNTLKPSSVKLHRSVASSSLKKAERVRLIARSPIANMEPLPRIERTADDMRAQCLTADEARRLLEAARAESRQVEAFYRTALDSGLRKSELLGLKWDDLDLDTGRLLVARQLRDSNAATFGPTKTGKSRVVDLGAETIRLLRQHKREQAELKMRHRTDYQDHNLIFAREEADPVRSDAARGLPLQRHDVCWRVFRRLIKASGVRPIRFHGLRHTSASLMLSAGVPAKVVQERLGHALISITLDTYSHVLPGMQQDAASRLDAVLGGTC